MTDHPRNHEIPLEPDTASKPVAGRPRWAWAALAVLAAGYLVLALGSLVGKSVTVDEFGHLPVGYHVLTSGDFRYCELNPPLMNALSALPLLALDLTPCPTLACPPFEPGYGFWPNGYAFMYDHAGHYQRLFVAARCVTVALVGGLGVMAFCWAGRLAPRRPEAAGLLAAGLIWFSPNLLAHGQLVTTDAGAACFITLAVWGLHGWLRRPTLGRAAACGVALGLAQLVKFSAVWLYPVFIVLAALGWRERGGASARRFVLGLVLVLALSGLVINAGYLFHGTLRPLAAFTAESWPLSALQGVLPGWLPVPLPDSYVRAFDRQLAETSGGDPLFLFGRTYEGGRWYTFLALLAIKTPVPGLALAAVAFVLACRARRLPLLDTWTLLLPAAVLLGALSLLSNKQLGLRMILPAAPLFWIWAAATLAQADGSRWSRSAVAVLLLWFAGESVRAYPHYLAYFNQFVGGPSQGYRYALDSNLDWGQDLIGLKRFMDERGIESIQLLYFGRVDPELYGIHYTVPTDTPLPGWFALSVSLSGRSYFINDHGRFLTAGPIPIDAADLGEPVATIGHTIRVYQVHPPPADR